MMTEQEKQAVETLTRSFTRMETLYKVKCMEVEAREEEISRLKAENAELRARLEIEDKIERGELVEVPKGAVVLTPEERKQAVREFLKLLKEKESPKLLMWEYGEGYLDCIKTAEKLAAQYGVEVEE